MTSPATALLCSDADLAAGDDERGTAARFDHFLLVEHHGGFGRDVADDALSAVYGVDADAVQQIDDFRAFAIRPVGRAEPRSSASRFRGRTGPAGFLRELTADPAVDELTRTAAREPWNPLIAVCTNGSRDRCCAIKGRDLAVRLHHELDAEGDEPTVVEISHLGGHRFAPTMLVLPWGYAYARLDPATASDVAFAAQEGLVHPTGLRGRADLTPAAQVADIIWRTELGPADIDAVTITAVRAEGTWQLVTATVAGRTEELRLREVAGEVIAATACGGKPIPTSRWEHA